MAQRKSDCRFGQGFPASLSMAKSAEAEKAGATQHSPKQRSQSARRLRGRPSGTGAAGESSSGNVDGLLGGAVECREVGTAYRSPRSEAGRAGAHALPGRGRRAVEPAELLDPPGQAGRLQRGDPVVVGGPVAAAGVTLDHDLERAEPGWAVGQGVANDL